MIALAGLTSTFTYACQDTKRFWFIVIYEILECTKPLLKTRVKDWESCFLLNEIGKNKLYVQAY